MRKNIKNALIVGIVFFVVGLITLPDYGINWDTINHLPRGQAYLHYFLTGKKDYSNIPEFKKYWQNPESLLFNTDIPRNEVSSTSFYQSQGMDYEYFIENDGSGHPPLSDILSSLFNKILFGKLRLINDIDAYRVYGVLAASVLVGLVYYWVSGIYGNFAGFISAISLFTYPLFFAESHFNNEKDIPLTLFWSFLLFSVYKGILKNNKKWILLSGVFLGLALGTKFNILFIPFVILPWLIIHLLSNKKRFQKIKPLIPHAVIAILIGIIIFIGTWPYLWQDIPHRLSGVFDYYKEIGTEPVKTLNLYPIKWIIYTTPVTLLVLVAIGIFSTIKNVKKEKNKISILFLLWLFVPILRVTMPGTSIYGGVRQIMEYVPAMAIMGGIGAQSVVRLLKPKVQQANKLVLVIVLTVLLIPIIKIHPNQNVYFNSLIGGLSGAKESNIHSWGNSFGAAYRQGIVWLNKNANQGAGIAFARELLPNVPKIWLRSDLNLQNGYRSGYLKNGEYVIALTYEGTDATSYFDRYLERSLNPVYIVDVDGVSILKVWKNDIEHTKEEYKHEVEFFDYKTSYHKERIAIELEEIKKLSRIEASFFEGQCNPPNSAYVKISKDGVNWERLPGTMPNEDWSVPKFRDQPQDGKFMIPLAGDMAKYIEIFFSPEDACFKNIYSLKTFVFSD